MNVDEAFLVLRKIRRECDEINFKVITVEDVYSLLFEEEELTEQEEEKAKEIIKNSWEMQHWSDMFEDDWDFFYSIDGLEKFKKEATNG